MTGLDNFQTLLRGFGARGVLPALIAFRGGGNVIWSFAELRAYHDHS